MPRIALIADTTGIDTGSDVSQLDMYELKKMLNTDIIKNSHVYSTVKHIHQTC